MTHAIRDQKNVSQLTQLSSHLMHFPIMCDSKYAYFANKRNKFSFDKKKKLKNSGITAIHV